MSDELDKLPVGNLTLLLARRLAAQEPITNIEQWARAAGIDRTMLDKLDDGSLQYIHIENLKKAAVVIGLPSLGPLFGFGEQPSVLTGPANRPISQVVQIQGMSMRELASRTSIRRPSLIALDKGEAVYFRVIHLFTLCDVLQVSLDDLLHYHPNRNTSEEKGGGK
jgi:DNA-binding Xre family transcriptional regulator